VTTVAIAEAQSDLLRALRRLGGKATVGDVVSATGMPADDVRSGLKALLETHQGHLAVSDSGEILYAFDPRLIRRGTEPLLARLKRGASRVAKSAFKGWIVLMLVVYFAVFVALVVAALVASQRGGGDRKGGWGGGGRRGHGGGFPMGNFWLWYWIMGSRWRVGRPYYGHRYERTLSKEERVPFYKKVFAFVFGPDRPAPTQQQLDQSALQLIRARRGVLTPAELVQHAALPLPDADEEMGRLMATYDGEPAVSESGELAYAFPGLMVSAHGRVKAREPKAAWKRLERPLEVTGNDAKSNAIVAGINGFNLLAAVTAPWFIFPRLGIGGILAYVGLVAIPVVYSTLFFAIPGLRTLSVRRENRRRERRNVRRILLGLVYELTLKKGAGVMLEPAVAQVASSLPDQTVRLKDVEKELHALAAEFDADVDPDVDGNLVFRFPKLTDQFAAAEGLRSRMRLEAAELGDIVYDTSDSQEEASARDLAAFDRELAGASLSDLGRYVAPTSTVGYQDDWEVALESPDG
jgi:hypothetical protein